MDPPDAPEQPAPPFVPVNEREATMLREITRLKTTRTLSGTEMDVLDVTIGDKSWSRAWKEVRR